MSAIAATPVALSGSSQAVRSSGPGVFKGMVLRETGGTNGVTVRVFDNGSGPSGPLLAARTVAAGGDFDLAVPDVGRWFGTGVYVQVTGSGVLEGSVFIG